MSSNDYIEWCIKIIKTDKNISEETLKIMFLQYKSIILKEIAK